MKKKVAAIVASSMLAFSANANPAIWIAGVLQGAESVVSAIGIVITLWGDYEDYRVGAVVGSYGYDTYVNYWSAGLAYSHKWRMYPIMGGGFQYTYTLSQNGSVLQTDHTPFEIGRDTGLPMTKREWSCSNNDPAWAWSAWSTSYITFDWSHVTLKWAQYQWAVPPTYNVAIRFFGEQWSATCGPFVAAWNMVDMSKTVPRNSTVNVPFNDKNLVIRDWSIRQP